VPSIFFTKQLHKNTHTAAQLVLVFAPVVVGGFLLVGIEPACAPEDDAPVTY